jgi:hypothetical protein
MRHEAKFGMPIGKVLWALGLALALALSTGGREQSDDLACTGTQVSAREIAAEHVLTPAAPESPELGVRREVTRYTMDFEGDHSLDVATVVEQVYSGYASYTVQLQLASGAEQSIAVTAPPGGLRLEMHDMTGDKVPNDLVLRPAFVHWLSTVLVNDGHDHFAVAISNRPSDSLSAEQDLESKRAESRGTAALMSSGFKAGGPKNGTEIFSQLRKLLLASTMQTVFPRWEHTTSSGRAPPACS